MNADADRPATPEAEPAPPTAPKARGGGPRTPEACDKCRRNSTRHGLAAESVFPDEMAEAIATKTAEFAAQFPPGSPYETVLVGEIAKAVVKLNRSRELLVADLRRTIEIAEYGWDSNRKARAAALAGRLPADPSRVASALKSTRQGCEWLIEQWERLGDTLASHGAWDEAQRSLAFDLLGVSPVLRQGSKALPAASDAPASAALVEAQLGRLRADLGLNQA
jgi:hypothetical protein